MLGVGKIESQVSDNPSDYDLLRTFVRQMISRSASAYADNENVNFVVNVQIDYLYEKDIDINGMPIKVADLQFTFNLHSFLQGLSFDSHTFTIKESGESSRIMLRNAIRKLNSRSNEFIAFIKGARQNIYQYYESNCDAMLQMAQQSISLGNFDEAIFFLGQVPNEVPCAQQARTKILEAYNLKLETNCEIAIAEIRTLINMESFSDAYDMILALPKNSRCIGKVDEMLDEMDHSVCEQYILMAESYFANGDLEKCVEALASISRISSNCSKRKITIERKIKASLDAKAKQEWDFRMKQYEDNMAKAKQEWDFSLRQYEDNRVERVRKDETDHEYSLKKLESDAVIKSRELDISVQLEKYRTKRDIQLSKNQRMVDTVTMKEAGKTYRAYFKSFG